MQQPSERFIRHGTTATTRNNGETTARMAQAWASDGWTHTGRGAVASDDGPRYLWAAPAATHPDLPLTAPHGFVCLVPGAAKRQHDRGRLLDHDGDKLPARAPSCSLEEVRRLIERDLAAG